MSKALRAVPAWGWLGAIVILSFAFRAWLARGMLAPFIMVDELIYSELARSLADTGRLLVRDAPASGFGVVYPLLLSPVYLAFESLTDAYAVVKTVNAFVMSLAAIPAYFIARRVASTGLSLLAALLAVCVPSLVYTATVMTENVFYPVFLTAALGLVLVLERPTLRRELVFYGLVVVAVLTRVQGVALVAAALTAPLLLALFERQGLGATLRPFRRVYTVLVGAAALVLLLQIARGQSLSDLLGAYSVVGDKSYDIGGILRFALWHLEELSLYLGVAPFAALIVLVGLGRSRARPTQAFLAATLALTFWFLLVVATFASEFASRIQERNLFVVAALFLVALVAWVDQGAPRPIALTVGALVLAGGLPLLFPFGRFIETAAISDTLALLPIWTAFGSLLLDSIVFSVAVGAVAMCAVFALAPARVAVIVPLAVLVWFAVMFKPVWSGPRGFKQAGAGALFQGIRGVERDWIDTAVPAGEEVVVVWTGRSDRFTVNENEFFNRRVGPVYYVGGPTPGGLAETEVTIGRKDGVVRLPDGTPVTANYVLVDDSIAPDGMPVARDDQLGMTLWRIDGELVSTTTVSGLYPNDTWSGPAVTYTRRRCDGGAVAVSLTSDPTLFRGKRTTVEATPSGGSPDDMVLVNFGAAESTVLRVPLVSRDGICRVDFDISPTLVPSEVLPGSTDDRELGAHFNSFSYEPPQ
jgi:hypothetical protein